MIHARRPCKTCPFNKNAGAKFSASVLDRTVGENIRGGTYAHRCHVTLGTERENVCVGFLLFLEINELDNGMVRLGLGLGIIDLTRLDRNAPIYRTWAEVLDAHLTDAEADAAPPTWRSVMRDS